jgi:hypothetical protein
VRLVADDRPEIRHHLREGVRAAHRSQDVLVLLCQVAIKGCSARRQRAKTAEFTRSK